MLPGLSGCGARGILTTLPVWTNFYFDASTTLTVPAGYSIARVSAIGMGGDSASGIDGYGVYRQAGGGGGEFRQSIISLTPGETLTVAVDSSASVLRRGSTDLVRANAGGRAFLFSGNMLTGTGAGSGIGTIGHNGANGDDTGTGGGAGGSADNAMGSTRGAGINFIRSSDNLSITNGGGGSNFGGGSSTYGGRGNGVLIIEFGGSTLTAV